MGSPNTQTTAASSRVNPQQLERFMAIYAPALVKVVIMYQREYAYPVSEVPGVVVKMRRAFEEGSYNKDGRAIAATCRALNIKHTRKAIEAFLTSPTT